MNLTDGRIARTKHIGRSRVVEEVELKRIYERLRKQSYRSTRSYGKHAAYVAGVRDALTAIARVDR